MSAKPVSHIRRFPHACGDTPLSTSEAGSGERVPPRVWGYAPAVLPVVRARLGSPTRVGIRPLEGDGRTFEAGFPHACGDTPADDFRSRMMPRGSPTRVGIRPVQSTIASAKRRFPRACGDTSEALTLTDGYLGPILIAPSSLIVSPLIMVFSTMCATKVAYSLGSPSRGGKGTCAARL